MPFRRCRNSLVPVVFALSILLTGCFEIEQSITLDADLSGTAAIDMSMDMEFMVYMMAAMAHAFSGEEGPPPEAAIEKARQEFLAQKEEEKSSRDMAEERAKIESELPEGIEILDFDLRDEGLELDAHVKLAFDHVTKLEQLNEVDLAGAAGGGTSGASPFGDLTIVDEGDTLLISTPAKNPTEEMPLEIEGDEDLGPLADSLAKLRIAYRITTPLEAVEHNATRVEGNSYIWEWNLESLEAMDPEASLQAVKVRLRK